MTNNEPAVGESQPDTQQTDNEAAAAAEAAGRRYFIVSAERTMGLPGVDRR